MSIPYRWKTALGQAECSSMTGIEFYICREFDKAVYEQQEHIKHLQDEHQAITTELRNEILSWRFKYLELLEKVTSKQLLNEEVK